MGEQVTPGPKCSPPSRLHAGDVVSEQLMPTQQAPSRSQICGVHARPRPRNAPSRSRQEVRNVTVHEPSGRQQAPRGGAAVTVALPVSARIAASTNWAFRRMRSRVEFRGRVSHAQAGNSGGLVPVTRLEQAQPYLNRVGPQQGWRTEARDSPTIRPDSHSGPVHVRMVPSWSTDASSCPSSSTGSENSGAKVEADHEALCR